MDLQSCQEKLQKTELFLPSHPSATASFSSNLPGQPGVALGEHWRNLLLVLKADRVPHQAPGPACPHLCAPGPACLGMNVHTLHVHVHADRPGRTGQEGEPQGLWSEARGGWGDNAKTHQSSRQQPLSNTSLHRVLSMAPHSSLSTAAPNPRARTNGITVGPALSPGGKERRWP